MDFEFSSDALMLRDMLRRFVTDEARPMETKYFTSGSLEPKERARLHTVIEQMGLWGITVPEELGGGGLDIVTACLLHEELGKTFLPIDIGDIPPLLHACQGEQVAKFLEPVLAGKRRAIMAAREPGALRPNEWKATASLDGSQYNLNGTKLLPACPSQDDYFLVLARESEGFSAFLVDQRAPGLQIVKNGAVMLHLETCQAPIASRLGEPGQALKLGAEAALNACVQLGARYVGLAQRLREMSVEYAKSWTALGALLKDRPSVQSMLAEMQVLVESSRWLVYHAAWLAEKHRLSRAEAAEVRLATGTMLNRVTDLATLVYGGPGPSPQIEIQRYVHSAVPPEAIQLGLEFARNTIASQLLAPDKGDSLS
jgi:acyl-CoA dehydrogenase